MNIFLSDNSLVLRYSDDSGWIHEKIRLRRPITINKTFLFEKNDIIDYNQISIPEDYNFFEDDIFFKLGEVIDNEYILIKGKKLLIKKEIRFYDFPNVFKYKWFRINGIYKGNGSLFWFLSSQFSEKYNVIAIGNNPNCYLSWVDFEELVDKFPNNYEIDLYTKSRVTSVLKQYSFVDNNYEEKLSKYRKRKSVSEPLRNYQQVYESEIDKYKFLLDEIKDMLLFENIQKYDEDIWQGQIAKIFLLLFPQYICFFEKVTIKNSFKLDNDANNIEGKKFPDFMLISNNGNVDILEIKRPKLNNSLLRKGDYRDNYIPSLEFSGTVMQTEKYILNLIKWGTEGEDRLNKKYSDQLPDNLKLQINSPKGIIILGYKKDFNSQQNRDFEIIKRKYANIVDIITYDDLIQRLENTLKLLELKSKS